MDFEEAANMLNDKLLYNGDVLKALLTIRDKGQKHLAYQFEKDRLDACLFQIADIFDMGLDCLD